MLQENLGGISLNTSENYFHNVHCCTNNLSAADKIELCPFAIVRQGVFFLLLLLLLLYRKP